MNDSMQPRAGSGLGWAVVGIAIGAALGAGVALLLAPESGARTRERLRNATRDLSQRAVDTFEDARGAVTALGEDARSAVHAGQDAFAHDRAARDTRADGVIGRAANLVAKVVQGAKDEAAR